jgi:hypothetical protein
MRSDLIKGKLGSIEDLGRPGQIQHLLQGGFNGVYVNYSVVTGC